MDILVKNLLLLICKFQKFLINYIQLGLGKFISYIFCPIGQCCPTASCSEHNGRLVYPNIRWIYYFISAAHLLNLDRLSAIYHDVEIFNYPLNFNKDEI